MDCKTRRAAVPIGHLIAMPKAYIQLA